jgi:hypothetical protein
MISKIVHEIRGFSLADNPSNFYEMMQAYDNVKSLKGKGLKVILQLLYDTRLWLGILRNYAGTNSPKYIVACNKIASSCICLMASKVEAICSDAIVDDLLPHLCHHLSAEANELLNVLKQIEMLCLIPETHKRYSEIEKKLLIALEQLKPFVTSE